MKRMITCLTLLVLTVLLAVSASAATIEIGTADELIALMGDSTKWSDDIVLKASIDLTGMTQSPIGTKTVPFKGTFDGGNNTIKGIDLSGAGNIGLFGYVDTATIKDLTIEGKVTSTANCAAGFIAYLQTSATITNCVNKCTVTTSGTAERVAGIVGFANFQLVTKLTISDCVNEGDITAYRNMGGIVGYAGALNDNTVLTIERCTNSGDIKATCTSNTSNVAGILGVYNDKAGKVYIKQCRNAGSVTGYFNIGGIVGNIDGTDTAMSSSASYRITECWNSGAITSTRSSDAETGGIIGYMSNVGWVSDCLNTGVVTGKKQHIGGLFGMAPGSSKVVGATNNLNKTAVVGQSGANNFVNSIGGFLVVKPKGTNYYTGTLQGKVWENGSAKSTQYNEGLFGSLNANNVWVIAADPELKYFHVHNYTSNITYVDNGDGKHTAACACGQLQTGATPASHDYGDTGICVCGAVKPLSEITNVNELLLLMNAETLWTSGSYTLKNDIDLSTYTGSLDQQPIGTLSKPFTASFDGCGYTISGLDLDESGDNVGLFGALGEGAVVKNVTVQGSVKGNTHVGGVIGIVGTTSKGANVTIENCHNKAAVSGAGQVGGVVGYFHSTDYKASSLKNCSNTGKITGSGNDVGGVAGILWEVTASGLTNSGAVSSPTSNAGGIAGRVTGNLDISNVANSGTVRADAESAGGIFGQLMNTPSSKLSGAKNSGVVTGKNKAGGIIGDVSMRDTDKTAITLCENIASVTGERYVGGIIGAFYGKDTSTRVKESGAYHVVSECQNSGTITSTGTYSGDKGGSDCGGIFGLLFGVGDVNNCRNIGTVKSKTHCVGGFVGRTWSYVNISNCLADCVVEYAGEDSDADYLIYARAFMGYPGAKKLNNCYYNAEKCDLGDATNAADFANSGGTTPKAYSGFAFDTLNSDGKWLRAVIPALLSFHTEHDNTQCGVDNGDGTHTLICPCGDEETRGETVEHTYDVCGICVCGAIKALEISTADQLVELMNTPDRWMCHYALTANINLGSYTGSLDQQPIGDIATPFTGHFDGNGYTISGLNIEAEEYAGLFGYAAHAEIRNLTVSGTVKATGYYAGGIVAYAGIRYNAENTFVIENCRNRATVKGGRYVGGVVGYFVGSDTTADDAANLIRNCYNSGIVIATSTEEVNDVGGIAGILWNVTASNLHATGKVTASHPNAGGIVGRMTGYVAICNSYANAEVVGATEGISYIRAFCGKPDATDGIVACYYNPEKTSNEDTAVGWRVYEDAAFDILNEDGLWLQMAAPELVLFHTAHDNSLAWTDLGAAGHAPICPCGDEDTIGTAVAHTYDPYLICTACGNADRCKHLQTETYIDGTPNCQTDVLSWERCVYCLAKITPDGEETVIAADPRYHNFAWTVQDGAAVCACTVDGCTAVDTANAAPETFTDLYVSMAGSAAGGFSENAPLNDYDMAMQIAATMENDVTIHVLDQASIPFPSSANAYFTYLEPAHTNKITVCGTEDVHAVLLFSDVDKKMIYGLNGPTAFENVEFSFGGTAAYLYLVARHNPLVLGEGISADFNRVNGSSTHSGNIYVIGGCYESYFESDCAGKSIDVTICSGTYRTIIGGHYSGKNCGTACDISLKLLGDIVTRNQICAGNVGADSGKLTLTIDGNLSVGTFFTFGTQATGKKASETTVLVRSGSVMLNGFHASPLAPMSLLTIGALDADHNVLDYTKALTVYVNENSASAMTLREAMLASIFSAPNQGDDFASKVKFLFMGEDGYCEASGGAHTADGSTPAGTASTCTVQGYEIYHCSACGTDYTVALPLAAHTYGEAVTIPATCIAPEMTKEVCTVCSAPNYTVVGDTFADHYDPELTGVCRNCNLDLTLLCEHAFGAESAVSTGCGTGTQKTCTKCGKVVVDVISDGHNYGKYTVTVEPTATMAGIKSRTCKSCGKVETALMYADDSINADPIATDASGNLAALEIASSKLTKGEKAALNALLQQDAYGSEIKISYETDGDVVTGITYSIPVPAEYTDYENVMVVVKDDEGKIHFVDFKVEKGYIVFTF